MISANVRLNSRSQWAQSIRDAARPEIQRIADDVAAAAERNVVSIVTSEFSTGDSGRKGDLPLRDSFQAHARPSPGRSVIEVTLETRPGANYAKVGALENGSRRHTIRGNSILRFEGTHGIEGTVYTEEVNHPGTVGARFMQRAINQAIQEVTGIRRR